MYIILFVLHSKNIENNKKTICMKMVYLKNTNKYIRHIVCKHVHNSALWDIHKVCHPILETPVQSFMILAYTPQNYICFEKDTLQSPTLHKNSYIYFYICCMSVLIHV